MSKYFPTGNICPSPQWVSLKNGGSYIECTPFLKSFHSTWTREVSLVHSAKPGSPGLYRNTEFLLFFLRVKSGGCVPRGQWQQTSAAQTTALRLSRATHSSGATCPRKGHHLSQEHCCFKSTGEVYFCLPLSPPSFLPSPSRCKRDLTREKKKNTTASGLG